MLEQLKQVLQASEATDYQITVTKTRSHEFFFVRHDLEMNRIKDVTHYLVQVFLASKDQQYVGDATFEVPNDSTVEEITELVKKGVYAASFVKNPAFHLPKATQTIIEPRIQEDALAVAQDFVEVMRDLPETETEDVNSYEIFVNEVEKHILNSQGVDVTYSYLDSMVEVVINARLEQHEIELYRNYRSGSCDKEYLRNQIIQTMQIGKDKCIAKDTPCLQDIDVVFTSSDAVKLFRYYTNLTASSYKYQQMSQYEIGQSICEEPAKGDTITLYGVTELKNSSRNYRYDEEGTKIEDCCLIQENVTQNFWGSNRFSQYLGIEHNSVFYNFVVEKGTHSKEELCSGRFLEVVEFSDFQVDALTGEFAGEIRLAYYHTEDGVQPLSGGSIAGNMREAQKQMWLSKQQKQYDNYLIPEVVRLKNVSITGIE
ncbi:MAG: metallopeptidase TldD-related protein [Erysipelotrichaceae bacterium]|nr:metallopeptidase TldD-related protein [Erysipelotrichaceae bacterium]